MSGTFTIGEKKVRPGTYYRYENVGGVETVGAINGIGAALFRASWGPLNKVFDMDITMQNNIDDYYGSAATVKILKEMFNGGTTTIRAVRIGDDDGTSSSITLKNSTDADALTITAAYPGDRAFTVSIRTSLISDNRECVIYEGTTIFEKIVFTPGDGEIDNLIAAFVASDNFIAKKAENATGTLKLITQQTMTVGKNPTVTTESYDNGTNALERVKWNCMICDSDDVAVHTLLQSFIEQSYQTGHLGMGCVAGVTSKTFEERAAIAAAYNDEKMVYVLNGWIASDGTIFAGYLAAARIGGMVAAFEANTSLTHDVITNAVSLTEALTNSEIIKAEQKGCVVLTLNDDDQVWIDSAINTLITCDDTQDEGWKKIRRTKTRFELMDRVDSTTDKLVGKVNNDTDGRQTIMAAAQKVIGAMVGEKKILDGSTIYEDEANPAEGDSAWFKLAIDDIDSAEKIYMTYQFRFSQNS